jgi:hypothetical protein
MAKPELIVTVKISWWVPVYVQALQTFCMITGMEPDFEKALRIVMKGMKAQVRNA